MYRRRRYRRVRLTRPLKAIRYASETFNDSTALSWATDLQPREGQTNYIGSYIPIVPAVNIAGIRKVKNFTIEINPVLYHNADAVTVILPFIWALVYVPEGQNPNPNFGNTTGGGSLYEPNQNVIISGTGNTSQAQYRKFTRLARNLNSGDRIFFMIRLINAVNFPEDEDNTLNISLNINYAICYN